MTNVSEFNRHHSPDGQVCRAALRQVIMQAPHVTQ